VQQIDCRLQLFISVFFIL